MDWKLEVVVVPVSDVDRAKKFYTEQLGFNADFDSTFSEDMRAVQLTPPGSGCSIVVGKGLAHMPPGMIKGLQLVVSDLVAARGQLVERGVSVSEIQIFEPTGPRPAREGDNLNNNGFAFFSDPDGNGWAVQQIDRGASA